MKYNDCSAIQLVDRLSSRYKALWPFLEEEALKNIDEKSSSLLDVGTVEGILTALVQSSSRSHPTSDDMIHYDTPLLSAIYPWRLSKSIYDFDVNLMDSLKDTPIERLPTDLLKKLPEWAMYFNYKDSTFHYDNVEKEKLVQGFFVHLNYSSDCPGGELRFVINYGLNDTHCELTFMGLDLSHEYLDDAIEASHDRAVLRNIKAGKSTSENNVDGLKQFLRPVINMVLYVCSEEPDLSKKPIAPSIKNVKGQRRLYPSKKPQNISVGYKIGSILINGRNTNPKNSTRNPTHGRKAAHLRRAHWHTYRVGPRNNFKYQLKWLQPKLINSEGSEVIPTIRK